MQTIKRLLIIFGLVGAMLASALPAFADNPHAGNSGHFKGGSNPCQNDTNNPNCPPFGQ